MSGTPTKREIRVTIQGSTAWPYIASSGAATPLDTSILAAHAEENDLIYAHGRLGDSGIGLEDLAQGRWDSRGPTTEERAQFNMASV